MLKAYLIQEAAETSTFKPEILYDKDGAICFTAVLQEADKRNRNKRYYPKSVLDGGMNSVLVQEKKKTRNFVGEAGHPMQRPLEPEYNKARQKYIDQTRLSHFVLETWWNGSLLMGKLLTTNTSIGKDMASLIRQGMIPAFSLRAQGLVDTDLTVHDPLTVIAFDWVMTPSNDKAYMEGICDDSRSAMFNVPVYNNNYNLALNESAIIYDDGLAEEITELPTLDYRFNGNSNNSAKFASSLGGIRSLSEDKSYFVYNDGVHKSLVNTNEFILKDIRKAISARL